MFELGWGGEAWKWRRKLWAWEEEMVVECRSLLLSVMLQVDIRTWIPDPSAGYIVRGAYHMLSHGAPHTIGDSIHADLLWRKEVPLKVMIFAWRLF
jgi:hypothetical protein